MTIETLALVAAALVALTALLTFHDGLRNKVFGSFRNPIRMKVRKGWAVVLAAAVLSFGLAFWLQGTTPHASFTEVTTSNFQSEVLQSNEPVLIEFYSNSADSQANLITLTAAAQAYAGKVKFVKIDVSSQSAIAQAFQVQTVPETLLLKIVNGTPQLLNGGTSVMSEEQATQWIADGLSGKALQQMQQQQGGSTGSAGTTGSTGATSATGSSNAGSGTTPGGTSSPSGSPASGSAAGTAGSGK